jgi:hypothetical protein
MKKAIPVAIICFLVSAIFIVVNLIHFWHFPVSVILYACALDLVIAVAITTPAVIFLQRRMKLLSTTETVLSMLLACAGILLYAVMGPTVVDRSLSLYIVEKLHQRGGAIALEKLDEVFVREYMPEFRLVDVRVTEQLASGTAEIDGECLVLTSRGQFIAQVANAYRRFFLPRKRVLGEEITDVLTRPFDESQRQVDVSCRRGGSP